MCGTPGAADCPTTLQTTTMCDTPGAADCPTTPTPTMCGTPGEADCLTTPTAVTMCDTPGEADCSTQTPAAAPDTASNSIVIAIIAGTLGGIGVAILVVAIVICTLFVVCRKKRPHQQNQSPQNDVSPDGLTTIRSENPYDYIESVEEHFSSPYQQTAQELGVAYNARTGSATIIPPPNPPHSRENGNAVYETIGDRAANGTRRDEVETKANCSYAPSNFVLVSPNSAYGVTCSHTEEDPYYI